MQIESNGSTFHCRIDGDEGPWVMLSHGLATDTTMWDELAAAPKRRYRVLRYDARGKVDRRPSQAITASRCWWPTRLQRLMPSC